MSYSSYCVVLGCPVQEGTGRIVMWNLGILNSFTMEVIVRVVFFIFLQDGPGCNETFLQ